jgi:AcrR family transcriptional regulator
VNAGRLNRPSLRERKKQATREALSSAALDLVLERGLDGVVVEEIAAKADVSPRTFNNYFSSKEEAVVVAGSDRTDRFLTALRARPPDETLWEALDHVIPEIFPAEKDMSRVWIAQARLIKDTPGLAAERLRADAMAARALADVIAERTGTNVENDLLPRLAAAAVMSAVRVAIDYWVETNASASLTSTVRKAVAELAVGLTFPTTRNRK